MAILKEGEAGMPVAEVCRKHGISAATWYAWKSRCAGVTVSEPPRVSRRISGSSQRSIHIC